MRKLLNDFSDEPVYNMKAVEQQTSISAATLRAWERRYALVEPKRTASGYRLYSDHDIALLRWVRNQMNEGLTISRVVAMLESHRQSGDPIWLEENNSPAPIQQDIPLPASELVHPLFEALINLDDGRANEIMDQAFSMFSMSTVYVDLIAPTLVEVGEAWHRGQIFISIEHFATAYLRGRLLVLLQAYPRRPEMPMIFVGCAPGERHEIGALIFAVMLRQQGYNVIYLGQDVPIDDMIETALQERPAMICLSANSAPNAVQLKAVQERLDREKQAVPIFGYGGQAFDHDPVLRQQVGGHYLGVDPRESVNLVHNLLRTIKPTEPYNG